MMKYRDTPRPHIKVGDVVLLYDEGTKQAYCKLAVINELIQGSNDEAQAAVIKVGSDKGAEEKHTTFDTNQVLPGR